MLLTDQAWVQSLAEAGIKPEPAAPDLELNGEDEEDVFAEEQPTSSAATMAAIAR